MRRLIARRGYSVDHWLTALMFTTLTLLQDANGMLIRNCVCPQPGGFVIVLRESRNALVFGPIVNGTVQDAACGEMITPPYAAHRTKPCVCRWAELWMALHISSGKTTRVKQLRLIGLEKMQLE